MSQAPPPPHLGGSWGTPNYVIPRTFGAVWLRLLLPLLLLELHIAKVHDGARQLVNTSLLLSSEAQDIESTL